MHQSDVNALEPSTHNRAFDTSSSLTLLHVKTHRTASTLHTLTASLSTNETHALRFASVNASRSSRAKLRIDTSTRRYTCCRDPCLFREHLEHEREPLTSDHQRQDKLLTLVHRNRHDGSGACTSNCGSHVHSSSSFCSCDFFLVELVVWSFVSVWFHLRPSGDSICASSCLCCFPGRDPCAVMGGFLCKSLSLNDGRQLFC